MNLNTISEQLLLQVKLKKPVNDIVYLLANYSNKNIVLNLKTDQQKKAFWINIYNAFYQIIALNNKTSSKKIFNVSNIKIGSFQLSLDDIEHGILRQFKSKYSLGFIRQFNPNSNLKKLVVNQLDYRIHFALNCGAKSCPPISFYTSSLIDEELNTSTISFLETDVYFDKTKQVVQMSRLFLWFYADFGKKKGINSIILKYLNQDISQFKIKYKSYDWSKDLHNFKCT